MGKNFILRYLLIFIFLGMLLPSKVSAAKFENSATLVQAKAAILIDAASGRVLYRKNADKIMRPASTTKIATAMLVLEQGELQKKVAINKSVSAIEGSSIWLEPGEVFTREELLQAMMLSSANDAAVALAENIAGSEENFVKMMNKKVEELQLTHTHFANCHGLDDPDHHTSASDLALIARQAMKNPFFRTLVTSKQAIIPWEKHPWDRLLINKNRLLSLDSRAIGIKPGYTTKAGNCLVGAANQGSLTLIAVLLNSTQVYNDAIYLFDYGFSSFTGYRIGSKEEFSKRVKVSHGSKDYVQLEPEFDLVMALRPSEEKLLKRHIVIKNEVSAPVNRGTVLGFCDISLGSLKIARYPLVAASDATKKDSFTLDFYMELKRLAAKASDLFLKLF